MARKQSRKAAAATRRSTRRNETAPLVPVYDDIEGELRRRRTCARRASGTHRETGGLRPQLSPTGNGPNGNGASRPQQPRTESGDATAIEDTESLEEGEIKDEPAEEGANDEGAFQTSGESTSVPKRKRENVGDDAGDAKRPKLEDTNERSPVIKQEPVSPVQASGTSLVNPTAAAPAERASNQPPRERQLSVETGTLTRRTPSPFVQQLLQDPGRLNYIRQEVQALRDQHYRNRAAGVEPLRGPFFPESAAGRRPVLTGFERDPNGSHPGAFPEQDSEHPSSPPSGQLLYRINPNPASEGDVYHGPPPAPRAAVPRLLLDIGLPPLGAAPVPPAYEERSPPPAYEAPAPNNEAPPENNAQDRVHDPLGSPLYRPATPQYRPASPRYAPASPQYSPCDPRYEPASPQYSPCDPQYEPASTQHGNTRPTEEEELAELDPDLPTPVNDARRPYRYAGNATSSRDERDRFIFGPQAPPPLFNARGSPIDPRLSPWYEPGARRWHPAYVAGVRAAVPRGSAPPAEQPRAADGRAPLHGYAPTAPPAERPRAADGLRGAPAYGYAPIAPPIERPRTADGLRGAPAFGYAHAPAYGYAPTAPPPTEPPRTADGLRGAPPSGYAPASPQYSPTSPEYAPASPQYTPSSPEHAPASPGHGEHYGAPVSPSGYEELYGRPVSQAYGVPSSPGYVYGTGSSNVHGYGGTSDVDEEEVDPNADGYGLRGEADEPEDDDEELPSPFAKTRGDEAQEETQEEFEDEEEEETVEEAQTVSNQQRGNDGWGGDEEQDAVWRGLFCT